MKQQAGIGIILALTTAMCWGALPIAMKQVLEVMAPPTVVFYRFLMASIGLGAILAIKGKLPPMPRDVQVNEEADQKTHKNQETDKQCFLNDGVRFPHDLHIGDNGNDIPSVHLGHGDIAKNKFLMPVAEHGYAYFAVFQGIAERLHHIRVVLALADEIEQVGKGLVAGGMD